VTVVRKVSFILYAQFQQFVASGAFKGGGTGANAPGAKC